MKFILTQETAIKHLRKLFPDPTKDKITIDEGLINAGRNLEEKEKNRTWIKNQMGYLRQYKFVKSTIEKNTGVMVGIELDELGKIALGRNEAQQNLLVQEHKPEIKAETKRTENQTPQVEIILQAMTKIKKDNQKIIYNINEGTISIQ